MLHIEIDILTSRRGCVIITNAGVKIDAFTFKNNYGDFISLKEKLAFLVDPNQIKISFESTGQYGTNLKSFISTLGYTYLEFNPQLTSQFTKDTSLRRTKFPSFLSFFLIFVKMFLLSQQVTLLGIV